MLWTTLTAGQLRNVLTHETKVTSVGFWQCAQTFIQSPRDYRAAGAHGRQCLLQLPCLVLALGHTGIEGLTYRTHSPRRENQLNHEGRAHAWAKVRS